LTDNLQNTIRDELISKGAETAGKATELAIDKVIEISGGLFGKKKLVKLSFGILFRFYDNPEYGEVLAGFERVLAKYRKQESNEVLKFGNSEYFHVLTIRQKADAVIPFVTGEEALELDQVLAAMVRASSAVLYLTPIVSEKLSLKELGAMMREALNFMKEFHYGLKEVVLIKDAIKFCKITVGASEALEIVRALRRSIPNIDSVIEEDDYRSITLQLTDSSIIDDLIGALDKSL
jgi:hypothetical protein